MFCVFHSKIEFNVMKYTEKENIKVLSGEEKMTK